MLALPPGAAAGAWLVWRRCLVSALPHWLRCVWAWLLSSQHREGVLVLKVIDGCRVVVVCSDCEKIWMRVGLDGLLCFFGMTGLCLVCYM